MMLRFLLFTAIITFLVLQTGASFQAPFISKEQRLAFTGRPPRSTVSTRHGDLLRRRLEAEDSSPASEASIPTAASPSTYVRCGNCQTIYAITEDDLRGRGRRLECTVCNHSWFQSKDRIMTLKEGFELVPLPQSDLQRISSNIQEGRNARFTGDCKLYVGNIAFECQEDELVSVFSEVGTVGEVSFARDEEGKMRGFGFVTMYTKEEGQQAIEKLDGRSLRGRSITVRESNH